MTRTYTASGFRVGFVLCALGIAAPALAERHGAQYDYARVISSQPIKRYVTVRVPVRECREETRYYEVSRASPATGVATIFGAVVGGVVGHQFGSGRGNDAATVAGSLIGAAVGNNAARRAHAYETVTYAEPVQHCRTAVREQREERIEGYHVVYKYRGQTYATRMPYDPGRELRVLVDVRPAG